MWKSAFESSGRTTGTRRRAAKCHGVVFSSQLPGRNRVRMGSCATGRKLFSMKPLSELRGPRSGQADRSPDLQLASIVGERDVGLKADLAAPSLDIPQP